MLGGCAIEWVDPVANCPRRALIKSGQRSVAGGVECAASGMFPVLIGVRLSDRN